MPKNHSKCSGVCLTREGCIMPGDMIKTGAGRPPVFPRCKAHTKTVYEWADGTPTGTRQKYNGEGRRANRARPGHSQSVRPEPEFQLENKPRAEKGDVMYEDDETGLSWDHAPQQQSWEPLVAPNAGFTQLPEPVRPGNFSELTPEQSQSFDQYGITVEKGSSNLLGSNSDQGHFFEEPGHFSSPLDTSGSSKPFSEGAAPMFLGNSTGGDQFFGEDATSFSLSSTTENSQSDVLEASCMRWKHPREDEAEGSQSDMPPPKRPTFAGTFQDNQNHEELPFLDGSVVALDPWMMRQLQPEVPLPTHINPRDLQRIP
ncbi:uncharacterized protein M421DRAFT_6581 [Didymella exigua CBS 183.55]|uniref:Uncharacterized protein n=1 Tax=Didymella exigua CBS 183.55 TaxID=1150837 RepID=A0A6A5RHR1_9PLEO|nr:uncharacterized protein M421DRAFT_6581 [Didymella exigua CBS 183.55]KAF1927023.1 hypothetical protein M421DRAFT_6581 [Didymella exigua CBS 183.55]